MKNTLTYPSYSGWITARTDDIQLTTDNMLLILPKPIVQLQKVLLDIIGIGTVGIIFKDTSVASTRKPISEITTVSGDTSTSLQVLDIAHYVVEQDLYKTLSTQGAFEPSTDDISKNNTSYYKRYDKNIKICTARTNIFEDAPIYNSIIYALNDLLKTQSLYWNGQEISAISAFIETTTLLRWQWRVVYEPLGENAKLNVPKTNAEEIPFAIPYNQQQQIASSVGLGRNMQSVANRTGTEQKQVVRYITKLSQMRRVGAVATLNGEIWRLTEVAGTFTPIRARVTETWTKGWSMRSEYVGINREFRSWNIPSEITERNLLYQDYCLITRKSGLNLADNAKVGTWAKHLLVKFIDSTKAITPTRTEQTSMWIYREGVTDQGVILTVSAFGFGNSLVFSGRTQDNLSAGIKRVALNSGDNTLQQNISTYYCKADGTLERAKILFASDIQNMNGDTYPEAIGSINKPYYDGALFGTAPYWFDIDKDPAEQINFTYQLHMLTDDPNLIIGTAWAAKNPLVHQYDSKPTRKYWKITKRLPQGAQVMTSAFGETSSSAICTVTEQLVNARAYENIAFVVPSGSLGVCVTDENNNILVAWQGGASATFTTYYTHDYGAIKKAVKG